MNLLIEMVFLVKKVFVAGCWVWEEGRICGFKGVIEMSRWRYPCLVANPAAAAWMMTKDRHGCSVAIYTKAYDRQDSKTASKCPISWQMHP